MTARNRDEDAAVTIVVVDDDERHEVSAQPGQTVREALLDAGLSPYTRLTERANCGGRGLCATCGVRLREDIDAEHWHDELASRFGYPRLSCQLHVQDGLVVELDTEKRIWGRRK
ncbi:2Fe-2S iron-sulfur cluster-binding protein [Halorubellus litoreus]|uniref:2Fe-2S iron-sulfur cluster-binding protein n=1 Tax=Halorubellus litoreus TaxID=755308 RepID=A0ABD5VH81_9EURY